MAYASPGGPKLVRMNTDNDTIAATYVGLGIYCHTKDVLSRIYRPSLATFITQTRI